MAEQMSEQMIVVRSMSKREAYESLERQLAAILGSVEDEVAKMSTVSAVLHHGFGYLWTGFYRLVSPRLLRVGPYQGTLGCLEIELGRGVCGKAAAEGKTIIVDDVTTFPGHITCDARSRSEIVVPVYDEARRLIAVLDIDSDRVGAFDLEDQRGLEQIVARCFATRSRA